MPEELKKKKAFVCTVECPYCEEAVDVYKEVETITPAVKAEKRETFTAVKVLQTKLE